MFSDDRAPPRPPLPMEPQFVPARPPPPAETDDDEDAFRAMPHANQPILVIFFFKFLQ